MMANGDSKNTGTEGPSEIPLCVESESKCFNKFVSAKFFTFCLCLVIFADSYAAGTIGSMLTTLEQRYELMASDLGWIVSSYNIGTLSVILFVVHVGSRQSSNRPKWIGVGVITMAFGVFVMCLPQFINQPYSSNINSNITNNQYLCDAHFETSCPVDGVQRSADKRLAFYLLVTGMLINGIGIAPVMPLGFSYIDDSVPKATSGLYIGIVQSIYGFGTILSFLLGAVFILLWVDFYRVETTDIDINSNHPSWVGAWWIGLLVSGLLYLFGSFPLFGFPKKIECHKPEENGRVEYEAEDDIGVAVLTGHSIKDLVQSMKRLLTNPPFITLMAGITVEYGMFFGEATFFPKYFETQFGLSPTNANILTGLIPVPAIGVGCILGGILFKRLNLNLTGSALLTATLSGITLVGHIILYNIGCTSPHITTDIDTNETICEVCDCSDSQYAPVCGADNITYFSPCIAGCKDYDSQASTYIDCSCLSGNLSQWTAVKGICEGTHQCNYLVPFLVCLFIVICVAGMEVAPQTILAMRSVDKQDKAMSLGFKHVGTRLFGMIPAPIFYGAVIDMTCNIFNSNCDQIGVCVLYDNRSFRHAYFGVCIALNSLSFTLFLVTWLLVRRTPEVTRHRVDGYTQPSQNGREMLELENVEQPGCSN
ncbi:solute carrier organic anion transporter family member 5A1-like [Anneissia japonica]|uniref:solute carrier organic anion transporter family member 5A1-like n=1 Tax=Anneissia japonica TaxID=1529436 RepID=UPI0014258F31|nr:solute carrier organic anion transporter family member 5A1-like [Anneissia japonica]XP_033100271.1 solute carrier organic anion transporter family member 5A1-like [Anneissia japonica]XP_033100272.1 solute carrier organic anion transporter family member 5A1-like [Anneissia japonica]